MKEVSAHRQAGRESLMMKVLLLILLAGGICVGQVRKAGGVERPAAGRDGSTGQVRVPASSPDEVEAAFAAFASIKNFEKIEKYPALSEADFRFYKTHYAPPIKGVIIDTDPQRAERMKTISDPLFRLHGLAGRCAVVVLSSDLPTVFTWKMTFVSVTTRDLELLGDEELTALVAHEIGHLYFAADLLKARDSGDDRLARVTELKCDLVALETLRRLDIKLEFLSSAIEKLVRARASMNIKSLDGGSPSPADRRRIVKIYTAGTIRNDQPE